MTSTPGGGTFGPAPGYTIPAPTGDIEAIKRSYQQRLRDVESRAGDLKAAMAANVVEASSADGAVTLTVTATGSVSSVRFGPKVSTLTPVRLGEAFMATYRSACQQAMARSSELVAEFAGADSNATKRFRESLPTFDEDPEGLGGAR